MTIMPAQLIAAEEDKAILLTLDEFKRHELTQDDVPAVTDPEFDL